MNLRKKLNRGRCRYCGCTDRRGCESSIVGCWWMDRAHTVCSNLDCVRKATSDQLRLDVQAMRTFRQVHGRFAA